MGAKPKITENLGYLRGSKMMGQVKIATSNLFIDTSTPDYDSMVAATFDGIGGMEFINSGNSFSILQEGSSLVNNASEIKESTSSKVNEKQADSYDANLNQYDLRLADYIPPDNAGSMLIGNTTYSEGINVYSTTGISNVYFSANSEKTFVSATGSMGYVNYYGTTGYGRTAVITFPTNSASLSAANFFNPGDRITAIYDNPAYQFYGETLTGSDVIVTSVSKTNTGTSPYNTTITVVAYNQYQNSLSSVIKAGSTPGALKDLYKHPMPYSHINIELQGVADDEEVEIQFISYTDTINGTI